MKIVSFLFLTFALSATVFADIKADIYSSSTCTGTPQETMVYTLNTCKDSSQGGQTFSMKPTVCNSTWAAINSYMGTATCAGNPVSTQTGVPGTCINDGSGSYVKINCNYSPSPTVKSGASELVFGLGALFVIVVGSLF